MRVRRTVLFVLLPHIKIIRLFFALVKGLRQWTLGGLFSSSYLGMAPEFAVDVQVSALSRDTFPSWPIFQFYQSFSETLRKPHDLVFVSAQGLEPALALLG
jgi:hypothetical protein